MKKKILMCTEASFYPTGYGVYSKELLSRLNNHPDFEVAELACYAAPNDPRMAGTPWKVYPNKPPDGSPELQQYLSSPTAEFGEFTFNPVCLDFRPDFVIDIRDPWVFEYQTRSPFRQFFKHVIMPTVDAEPQNPDWIDMFGQADAVLTYSEFGAKTIQEQSSMINHIGVASPCASDNFFPAEDKNVARVKNGLPTDIYIVGTVMRNQRRKLYPELFNDFRKYLDISGREDVYLYCHTSFPDVGWCIPELLMSYDLSNKVLFTYKCKHCKNVSCSFFSDAVTYCEKCHNIHNSMIGVSNGVTEPELAETYNTFDIYVQYANSEGFGMPQLEAAKCGNIVLSVNYSAMSSIIDNIDAIPIKVERLIKECETGCFRAIPSGESFISHLMDLTSVSRKELHTKGKAISENTAKFYSWDRTADEWINYFVNEPVLPVEFTWNSAPRLHAPAPLNNNLKLPKDQTDYLIVNVLGRPDLVGKQLWRRLLKDLTYGTAIESAGNEFYFNESHLKDTLKAKPFTYSDAYDSLVWLRRFYNKWEENRQASNLARGIA